MQSEAERLFFEGNAYLAAADHVRAEACFRDAVSIAPNMAEAHANLGWVIAATGAADEAMAFYRRALMLNSSHSQIRLNYGAFLARLKRFDSAQRVYQGALDVDPGNARVWSNLGALYTQMERFDEAEACCRMSLSLDPDYGNAHVNLAYLCLRDDRFEEGWAHYEWRGWKADLSAHAGCPRWAGESVAGKAVLIGHEAGYGDAIQFCRYVTLLKARGARHVSLVCPAALTALFATLDGIDELLTLEQPMPEGRWDVWTSLMSLPCHFGTHLDSMPAELPYLRADAADVARWRERLPDAGLRVGLAWRGNAKFENDADRSIASPELLHALAARPGMRFVSLQKDASEVEIGALRAGGLDLVDTGSDIVSFADTAAIVANLDLVISVDTAAAHLAGALATPCWLLLPRHMTDWRWRHGHDDSPWYPGTMRLFTQPRDGDWASVIGSVTDALQQWECGPA